VRLLLRSALFAMGLMLVVATGGAAYGEPAGGPASMASTASHTAEYIVIGMLLAAGAASLIAADRMQHDRSDRRSQKDG